MFRIATANNSELRAIARLGRESPLTLALSPPPTPTPPAGRGDSVCATCTLLVRGATRESPLPAGGVGVGGGERVRVRGGSRGPFYPPNLVASSGSSFAARSKASRAAVSWPRQPSAAAMAVQSMALSRVTPRKSARAPLQSWLLRRSTPRVERRSSRLWRAES